MITEQDLKDQQQFIQHDLICLLDDILVDEEVTRVCQVIVDRFKILLDKLKE